MTSDEICQAMDRLIQVARIIGELEKMAGDDPKGIEEVSSLYADHIQATNKIKQEIRKAMKQHG